MEVRREVLRVMRRDNFERYLKLSNKTNSSGMGGGQQKLEKPKLGPPGRLKLHTRLLELEHQMWQCEAAQEVDVDVVKQVQMAMEMRESPQPQPQSRCSGR